MCIVFRGRHGLGIEGGMYSSGNVYPFPFYLKNGLLFDFAVVRVM